MQRPRESGFALEDIQNLNEVKECYSSPLISKKIAYEMAFQENLASARGTTKFLRAVSFFKPRLALSSNIDL